MTLLDERTTLESLYLVSSEPACEHPADEHRLPRETVAPPCSQTAVAIIRRVCGCTSARLACQVQLDAYETILGDTFNGHPRWSCMSCDRPFVDCVRVVAL